MTPEVGLYPFLKFDTYRAQKDWISITELNKFDEAPAIYNLEVLQGVKKDPTPQQELGTGLHVYVLEPKVWASTYKVAEKYDRRTIAGKVKHEEYESMRREYGTIYLQQEVYDKIRFAGDSILSHPFVKETHDSVICEASLFWKDKTTNANCKGRIDSYSPDYRAIYDLKTTKSAKYFNKSIVEYAYYRQAAYYLDGLAEATMRDPWTDFYWLAVEMEAPYLCKVSKASQAMLEFGRAEYKAILKRFIKCREEGIWPGLPTTIEEENLPSYITAKAIEL